MSRVVLDTNVLVAAFAARGLCESVFEVCLEKHDLFISDHLILELKDQLNNKLKLPPATCKAIVELYTTRATCLVPATLPADLCRDPDDIPVLGLTVSAKADYLITGDKDLLILKRFKKARIVTPREFYDAG